MELLDFPVFLYGKLSINGIFRVEYSLFLNIYTIFSQSPTGSRDFEWYLVTYRDLENDVGILIASGVIEEHDEWLNWTKSKKSLAEFFKTQFEKCPHGLYKAAADAFKCRGKPVTASQLAHLANNNGEENKCHASPDFIGIKKLLKLDRAKRYLQALEKSGYKNSDEIYKELKDFFNEKLD